MTTREMAVKAYNYHLNTCTDGEDAITVCFPAIDEKRRAEVLRIMETFAEAWAEQ